MSKILFVGGPLHMETGDFRGRVPHDYYAPVPMPPPSYKVTEQVFTTVRYRLRRVRIHPPECSEMSVHPPKCSERWFQIYVPDGVKPNDYPAASRYLYQMYPYISALPIPKVQS